MNWLITAVGSTSGLTGMSGFLMLSIMIGGRITTDDGAGILLSDGPGYRMTPGDGVSHITEDGTGEGISAGTGSRPEFGDQPGFTGAGAPIMSGGVR